jgi:long-chain acyl-CoA synthetase
LLTHPSETLLIEADRKKERSRHTGREVFDQARALAGGLAERGVGPGSRVAMLMGNQTRWLLTATAVFFRGATLVPLDPKLSPSEHDALLAHAKPDLLVADHALWRKLSDSAPRAAVLDVPKNAVLGDSAERFEALAGAPVEASLAQEPDDVATIVYSSGTGGTPKGCMLPHRAYIAQLAGLLALHPMAPGDRFFSILPTNHAIDFMVGFVGPFCCGATVVHQRALRPELILATMAKYRVTHMALVPLVLTAFERAIRERLDALSPGKRRAADAAIALNATLTAKTARPTWSRRLLKPLHDAFGGALQVLFCGGAPTDRVQAEFFYRLGIPVVVGYGLTEACTVVSLNRLEPYRADGVGRPLDGVEVRIAHAAPGEVGEVQVRGPTVMLGYLDAPELTAEAFEGDWLRTGDLGWFDASGQLHLAGRSKDMIVTAGGKNVYPADIELALADTGCEELAVFSAHALWPGDTSERLVAVVRPHTAEIDEALRAQNVRLPGHKRLAAVVPWEAPFPRTASMKLKRGVLADQVREAGLPESAVPLR